MKVPYQEGTIFAVPLRPGGYGIGVVARTSPGGVMLNYFFGPARYGVPTKAELNDLRPQCAIKVIRVGDLHLLENKWPIIGQIQKWRREEWAMPPFIMRDEFSKRATLVHYPDDDANGPPTLKVVNYDQTLGIESDSMYGAGAAEIVLTKLLTPHE